MSECLSGELESFQATNQRMDKDPQGNDISTM
jgi:hypothetical protein